MKILGYDYRVRYYPAREDGGSENAGGCGTGKQIIFVDKEQHKQMQELTMLHEIIEALNYNLELNLPHEKIQGLEAGLYQVLTANGVKLSVLLRELEKC